MDQTVTRMVNQIDVVGNATAEFPKITAGATQATAAMREGAASVEAFGSQTAAAMTAAAAQLQNIDAQLTTLVSTQGRLRDATAGATVEHQKATGAVGGLTDALRQLEGHSGTVARGAEQIGGSFAAAAARVEGLTGALVGMTEAAPELIAVMAAITTAFAAFQVLGEGIKAASDAQTTFSGLSTTLHETGDAFSSTQKQINDFLDTESLASGTTREQLLQSLNELIVANHDVAGSETELRIAEEGHVATGRSVADIVEAMRNAGVSYGRSLAQLDENLKPMVAHHATLDQIMQVLHKDWAGALEDTNSNALAWDRAKAALAAMAERIGEDALPMLTTLAYVVLDGVKSFEVLLGDLKVLGQGFVELGMPIHGAILGFEAFYDAVHGNIAKATREWAQGSREMQDSVQELGSGLFHVLQGGLSAAYDVSPVGVISNLVKNYGAAHDEIDKAIREHENAALAHVPGAVGLPRTTTTPEPTAHDAAPIEAEAIATDKLTAADEALSRVISAGVTATAAFNQQLDLHGTSASRDAEQMAALKRAYEDTEKSTRSIGEQVNLESHAETEAEQAVRAKYAAYVEATTKLNDLNKALDGKTKLTTAEKRALDDAKNAQHEAQAAYHNADTTLQHLTTTLDRQRATLDANTKAAQAYVNAAQGVIDSLNDSIAKADAAQKEAAATYGQGPGALVDFWTQQYQGALKAYEQAAATGNYDQKLADDVATDYTHMREAQTAYWEDGQKQIADSQKAYLKWEDDAAAAIDKLVSNGSSGFRSLADAFKDAIHEMEAALLKSVIFKLFFPNTPQGQLSWSSIFSGALAAPFGGLPPSTPAASSNPLSAIGGALGTLPGSGGPTGTTSDPVNVITQDLGISAASKLTGNPNGIPGIPGVSGGAGSGAGGFSIGGSPVLGGLMLALGGIGAGKSLDNRLGGGALGGIAGGTLGALGAGIGLNVALGGGLGLTGTGGLFSMLAMNPLLFGGVMLGGALLATMGPHWGPPANYPDRSNTGGFGSTVADLLGSGLMDTQVGTSKYGQTRPQYGANGQEFSASASLTALNAATGGTSGISDIEMTLAKYGSKANAPAWLQPMWDTLVAQFGISATGSGALKFGHNIGQEQVTGATGVSGQSYSYQQLGQSLQQFETAINKAGGALNNLAVNTWSISRTYPNFNVGTLNPGNPYTATPSTGSGDMPPGNLTLPHPIHSPAPVSGGPGKPVVGLPGGLHPVGGGTIAIQIDADALATILAQRQYAQAAGYGFGSPSATIYRRPLI